MPTQCLWLWGVVDAEVCLSVAGAFIAIRHGEPGRLASSLASTFSRRYLPQARPVSCYDVPQAVMEWLPGEGFTVESAVFSRNPLEPDYYRVRGGLPEAYVNESPVFFLLQVIARSLARRGYALLTDSVAISDGERAVLLLGYPHTGKSSISAIALTQGYRVISTENTVVKPGETYIEVYGGTRVLVFDPRVRELYGVEVRSSEITRHGYELVDLDLLDTPRLPQEVVGVYLLYTSFSSTGASLSPVKGRKVTKTIWYFATALLKGVEYYEPSPLDTPIDGAVASTLTKLLDAFSRGYSNSFYEAFGSPLEVFKAIVEVSHLRRPGRGASCPPTPPLSGGA